MQTMLLPTIGEVQLRKSARAKRIILKIDHDGKPIVTVPKYVPYQLAKQFILRNQQWIVDNQPPEKPPLVERQQIGRTHVLAFRMQGDEVKTRVQDNIIAINYPQSLNQTDPEVQLAARKAAKRAVQREADAHLPSFLHKLAGEHGYSYSEVRTKPMKTRWGSCSTLGVITLNIWLMQLPDHLIEYVCCHELAHLNNPHHQPKFWNELGKMIPDFRARRAALKGYSPTL